MRLITQILVLKMMHNYKSVIMWLISLAHLIVLVSFEHMISSYCNWLNNNLDNRYLSYLVDDKLCTLLSYLFPLKSIHKIINKIIILIIFAEKFVIFKISNIAFLNNTTYNLTLRLDWRSTNHITHDASNIQNQECLQWRPHDQMYNTNLTSTDHTSNTFTHKTLQNH